MDPNAGPAGGILGLQPGRRLEQLPYSGASAYCSPQDGCATSLQQETAAKIHSQCAIDAQPQRLQLLPTSADHYPPFQTINPFLQLDVLNSPASQIPSFLLWGADLVIIIAHIEDYNHILMFNICKTCETQPMGLGYLVQKGQHPPKFYPKFADIAETDLQDQNTSVIRVNKSQFDVFNKSSNPKQRKFIDPDFPPSDKSLGNFDHIKTDKWKRIGQVIPNLTYFNKQVLPTDAVTSNNTLNIGYQAALAALVQRPQRIANILGKGVINPNGIYTFYLRHQGRIIEVVIDDFIPIGEDGLPLFSKPSQNSVWVILLEKARAKLHGSYELMIKNSLTVRSVLHQVTFAPTDLIRHQTANKDDLWNKLVEAVERGSVTLALSSKSQNINWKSINLTPNHYYTIIDAADLPHKLGSTFKVLKLRNAFKHEEYKGEGSLADSIFWEQVQNCDPKSRLLSYNSPKEGIFYLLYSDYLKYFDQTLINYYQPVRNYFNENCEFANPNGIIYDLNILKEGYYSIFIDQNDMQPQKKGLEYVEEGWSRSTLILFKDQSTKTHEDYEFMNGVLKYNQQNAHIRFKLTPGEYIVYMKLDPTIANQNFPKNVSLVVYSTQPVQLKPFYQQKYPNLLKTAFLKHGRTYKRQQYNNDSMWSSWKLIAQGGYAYIAFGNSAQSNKKFVIKFQEEIFNKQNYILKKPFKGKGSQTVQILPGQQQIILLRIKNSEIKQMNFPPPIDLQILDV